VDEHGVGEDRIIRIFVVDDEPLIREGIRKILDWSSLGAQIIGDAENGLAALSLAAGLKPDIVLTDIRMPEMDGLVLIERLKKNIPECIFIILSGYDDFDYARQAITLGVSNYVLKPLQRSEFSQVMKDCIQKCRKLQLRLMEEQSIKDKLERAIPALQENYILNVLNGLIQPDTDKLKEVEVDISNPYYIVCGFKFSDSTMMQLSYKKLFLLKEMLRKIMDEIDTENVKSFILIDYNVIRLILSFPDCVSYKELVKDIVNRLEDKINALYDEALIFGAGSLASSLLGLCNSAVGADRVLEYKSLNCNHTILFVDDLSNAGSFKPLLLTLADRKKLCSSVSQFDTEEISMVFRRFHNQVKDMPIIPLSYLHFMLMDLFVTVARNLAENGFQVEDVYDMKIFSYDFFTSFQSLDELLDWAENIFINVSKRFNEYRVSRPRKAIEDIKQYITQNIHKNINLNHISQVFYYNPTYISRIFKEEINLNFSSFVIEQKMEYAAKLLLETNLKLYEVCEKVGYADIKHFTSVFKSLKGMTPSDFKKQGCTGYEF